MPANGNKKQQKEFDNICENLKKSLVRELKALSRTDPKKLITDRYQKFRKMGEWV
jgi:acetyl-CoA carboxylase alpha subunit